MQNLNKYFPTLDEFINECIKMCPIVDVKDNVVFLKQALVSSRVNAVNFNNRVQELERDANSKGKNGYSEEFEVNIVLFNFINNSINFFFVFKVDSTK